MPFANEEGAENAIGSFFIYHMISLTVLTAKKRLDKCGRNEWIGQ